MKKSHLFLQAKALLPGLTFLILLFTATASAQTRAAPKLWPCLPANYQPTPSDLLNLAVQAADRNGLNRQLFLRLVTVESSWNVCIVSPKGAQGLTQLMPGTARRWGVQFAFDPGQNLEGGARYLRWLLDQFRGDVYLALAGYNAGENAVLRYGGVPPYPETRQYVNKISSILFTPSARTGSQVVMTAQTRPGPTPIRPVSAPEVTPAVQENGPPPTPPQEEPVETKSTYFWNRKNK